MGLIACDDAILRSNSGLSISTIDKTIKEGIHDSKMLDKQKILLSSSLFYTYEG